MALTTESKNSMFLYFFGTITVASIRLGPNQTDLGGNRLSGLLPPLLPSDAATKSFVQASMATSEHWRFVSPTTARWGDVLIITGRDFVPNDPLYALHLMNASSENIAPCSVTSSNTLACQTPQILAGEAVWTAELFCGNAPIPFFAARNATADQITLLGQPVRSCQEVWDQGIGTVSGPYTLDMESTTFDVWCEMGATKKTLVANLADTGDDDWPNTMDELYSAWTKQASGVWSTTSDPSLSVAFSIGVDNVGAMSTAVSHLEIRFVDDSQGLVDERNSESGTLTLTSMTSTNTRLLPWASNPLVWTFATLSGQVHSVQSYSSAVVSSTGCIARTVGSGQPMGTSGPGICDYEAPPNWRGRHFWGGGAGIQPSMPSESIQWGSATRLQIYVW